METGAWLPWKWALRQRSDGKVFPAEHAQYQHLQRERVIEQWCGQRRFSLPCPALRAGLSELSPTLTSGRGCPQEKGMTPG